MKKTLALVLALLMCMTSVFAQGASDANTASKTTKIGFVVIGDENDQGYTYNFMNGMNAAISQLKSEGYDVELSIKRNIAEDAGCVDLGGRPISENGANAAKMHYSADEDSNAVLKSEGMLLVDSGGQKNKLL